MTGISCLIPPIQKLPAYDSTIKRRSEGERGKLDISTLFSEGRIAVNHSELISGMIMNRNNLNNWLILWMKQWLKKKKKKAEEEEFDWFSSEKCMTCCWGRKQRKHSLEAAVAAVVAAAVAAFSTSREQLIFPRSLFFFYLSISYYFSLFFDLLSFLYFYSFLFWLHLCLSGILQDSCGILHSFGWFLGDSWRVLKAWPLAGRCRVIYLNVRFACCCCFCCCVCTFFISIVIIFFFFF